MNLLPQFRHVAQSLFLLFPHLLHSRSLKPLSCSTHVLQQSALEPTNERGTSLVCHGQAVTGHRNPTYILKSNALFNPSFSAGAQWDEDPSEVRLMVSFTRAIIFGSLKFEITRSHCTSMISSWLNEHVRTSTRRLEKIAGPTWQ